MELRSDPTPSAIAGRPWAMTQRATEVRARTRAIAESPSILAEELFRGVLVRERKRVDRSNQPFALMLLTVTGHADARRSTWAATIDALTSSTRETDVLGWFSASAVLGVILPEIASGDSAVLQRIEARVRHQLAMRVGADIASNVSIQLHVHPELANEEACALPPVDPLLEDFRRRGPKMSIYSAVKRTMDAAGGAVLLLLLAPLFLVIAALIKFEVERSGLLQAAAHRREGETVHDAQVPHDARRTSTTAIHQSS